MDTEINSENLSVDSPMLAIHSTSNSVIVLDASKKVPDSGTGECKSQETKEEDFETCMPIIKSTSNSVITLDAEAVSITELSDEVSADSQTTTKRLHNDDLPIIKSTSHSVITLDGDQSRKTTGIFDDAELITNNGPKSKKSRTTIKRKSTNSVSSKTKSKKKKKKCVSKVTEALSMSTQNEATVKSSSPLISLDSEPTCSTLETSKRRNSSDSDTSSLKSNKRKCKTSASLDQIKKSNEDCSKADDGERSSSNEVMENEDSSSHKQTHPYNTRRKSTSIDYSLPGTRGKQKKSIETTEKTIKSAIIFESDSDEVSCSNHSQKSSKNYSNDLYSINTPTPSIVSTSSSESEDDENDTSGDNEVAVNRNTMLLEPDSFKQRKVELYTEYTGPQWYKPHGNVITAPLQSYKLPEAFEYLPIHGRPKKRKDLDDFLNKKIRDFIGCDLNDEEFESLAQYCSFTHLKTGKELSMGTIVPTSGLLPNDIANYSDRDDGGEHDLQVVQKCRLRMERDTSNHYPRSLKYRGIRIVSLAQQAEDPVVRPEGKKLEPGKEILIRVRIYRPFPYIMKERTNRSRHAIFSRDVVLLGSQRLSALRDCMLCPNDVDMRVDVSDCVDAPPSTSAKEMFPSGFLFINNTFYVDTRERCADHSERLRAWAAARALGVFPTADLAARLADLPLRLGHPEVYVHQGNCEHLFTFSEVRLLAATDPVYFGQYPAHTATSQNQSVYCTTCAEFGARWIIEGCSRVPFDPAFFCDTCLKLYLYKDGEKIGNFKAYLYRGNELNVIKPG